MSFFQTATFLDLARVYLNLYVEEEVISAALGFAKPKLADTASPSTCPSPRGLQHLKSSHFTSL